MKLSQGRRRRVVLACAAPCLALVAALSCAPDSASTSQKPGASAQSSPTPQAQGAQPQQGAAWKPTRYEIRPEDLPPPREEESATNPPRVVARPTGAPFQVPPGFRVELYSGEGFENPRWMAEAPNGDVFVADSQANRIQVLRDTNGDMRPDARVVFAENLNQPFGMAFRENHLYVANTDSVVRFAYKPGQTRAEGPPEKLADLPGKGYNQHWTRNVVFSPDGRKMYVTVGSETNVSVEPEPMRAAITEFNPDGTGKRIFASGLRNPVGLAFHPTTGVMWTTVNERDRLGDDLVPDYLTSVRDGGFYGWPYSYIGKNVDPRRRGERPDLVAKSIVPDLLIQSHSAALGLVFYAGEMFPAEYRGDAFVALRGSWNRTRRTGYKIIRVPFREGRPAGHYEDFLTGFLPDDASRTVWGRPVGLLVLRDGSLLLSEDGNNTIWRITYQR
ncbi:MAG TPA: sorbosone dehydrogenase family protein [Pyrinomonadaceae bacterium]|nr:sorbosone dehydrogenase family protein [Pyrinomonadaceae bacterium]